MSNAARVAVVSLTFSALGLATLVGYESYTDDAIRPVKGDRPTYGFGNTVKADGKPVQMGDQIKPPAAVQLAVRDVTAKEGKLKACFGDDTKLFPWEYDVYVRLAYQNGADAVCRSSIPGKLKRGEYAAACKAVATFRHVQGRNCCLPENRKFCGGVCTRVQAESKRCLGELP
jgi:lysozyme